MFANREESFTVHLRRRDVELILRVLKFSQHIFGICTGVRPLMACSAFAGMTLVAVTIYRSTDFKMTTKVSNIER
jgi:hypothetical protein